MSFHVVCACGADAHGETEDEIVEVVQAHVREAHPDQVDEFDRERILEMAHEH